MIIIAIGANLPTPGNLLPLQTCESAVHVMAELLDQPRPAVSQWYETRPVPPSGQPPYVNGAVCFERDAEPAALLRSLQAIEARFGRRRSVPNAARTLDLDIVAIGATVRAMPDPVLPHPRMHERAFVLRPVRDIAPAWRHPILGRTAAELLATLPAGALEGIHPLGGAR